MLLVPLTLVGAESDITAHLVTVLSNNNPGDLSADTDIDDEVGIEEKTLTIKLLDSS